MPRYLLTDWSNQPLVICETDSQHSAGCYGIVHFHGQYHEAVPLPAQTEVDALESQINESIREAFGLTVTPQAREADYHRSLRGVRTVQYTHVPLKGLTDPLAAPRRVAERTPAPRVISNDQRSGQVVQLRETHETTDQALAEAFSALGLSDDAAAIAAKGR